MQIVAYLRVSTARQGASGLGLEAQRAAVQGFAAAGGHTILAELVEVESGGKADRPQLTAALAMCRLHRATLVIAKLDRLARNVAFIANLMDGGVEFVACDMPHANRLTLHLLAAIAEHQREIISQRTKAALAAAKARGVRLGNPNGAAQLLAHSRKGAIASAKIRTARAKQRDEEVAKLIEQLRTNKPKQRVCDDARDLANIGVKSPNGGVIYPEYIRRIQERAKGI